MRTDCIEKALKRFFAFYGRFLARHPILFIAGSLVLAIGLGSGLRHVYVEDDAEFLYTPDNGPAKEEKRIIESIFGNHTGEGAPISRRTSEVATARIIVISKSSDGVLEKEPFEEILRLDNKVKDITIQDGDKYYTFDNICAKKWNSQSCESKSNVLTLYGFDANNLNTTRIGYPFAMRKDGAPYFIGNEISGVELKDEFVLKATAMQLSYSIQGEEDMTEDWLDAFIDEFEGMNTEFLDVYVYTTHSLDVALSRESKAVRNQFSIAFTLLMGFSVLSCLRLDCVLNKPTLAIAGVLSACLAILSGFGLIALCGVPVIDISSSAPYFIISIGVDDMFIMMASWKNTNPRLPVDTRTSLTLSDAALSITITSLTDTLVFVVGAFSPFPAVSYFSILTGSAVFFDYIYQITFFAGCMVISGRREAASRHSIFCCVKVKPDSTCCGLRVKSESSPSDNDAAPNDAVSKSGGSNNGGSSYTPVASDVVASNMEETKGDDLPAIESDELHVVESPHPLTIFFRDRFSPFILKPGVKAVILFLYCVYIGCAIYGLTCLQEGLSYQEILPKDSFVTKFLDIESTYFKKFGFPVSVMIPVEVDFSNPEIQIDIDRELARFENQEFTLPSNYSVSWLRQFIRYSKGFPNINPMTVLDSFLNHPDFNDFTYDIEFDNAGENIIASRFYVTTTNIQHTSDERKVMDTFRETAESSSYNITVFTPPFIFFDQYLKVLGTTFRSLGIALLSMMLVSLMLIPVPMCAVWVTATILSIELGMIGFMALWGVNLDPVSMIVIIVCIGFSVDFPAHITYHYATSKATTPDERVKEGLYSLGMPVLQGAGSSILGVLVISSSDVYIFSAFFKTMFLVISLGALHALFILPIMLSLFSRRNQRVSTDEKSNTNQNPAFEPNIEDGDEAVTQQKLC
ncbi:patched domain-containing protein 3-like [Antedon mediterranea]|uniref:patched domain-containing protein 3-like n=1 Tax=Antedon mediterranea TaxID=105859 RepID=UPI003AF7344F